MKRLVLVPVVVAPIAVAGMAFWTSGLAWAVITTFARTFAPRPDTAETEADPI